MTAFPPLPTLRAGLRLIALLAFSVALPGHGQSPPPSAKLKDQMRPLWTRSNPRFIRGPWRITAEIPLTDSTNALAYDPFAAHGGESALNPVGPTTSTLDDGTIVPWRNVTSWGDLIDLSDGAGVKSKVVAYAATTIKRETAGPALLCLGSDDGMRAWVNGKLVADHPGPRPLTFDEDRVEVNLQAGDNLLLVKVVQHTGPWFFVARVLASGAIPPRMQEIAPSFTVEDGTLVIHSDLNSDHAAETPVTVELVAAGGKILAEQTVRRGADVHFDSAKWPDGAYEIRASTRQPDGRRTATHLAWYKGDAIAAARDLVAAAAQADVSTPAGQTIKMLGDLVLDRLGPAGLAVTGNPWWDIHAPLMEYAELQLEAAGATGRPRARRRILPARLARRGRRFAAVCPRVSADWL